MRGWYNFLVTGYFLLTAPYYFLRMRRRGNWRRGFGQRFGRYDSRVKQALTNRHALWFHAVSVGEVNLCTQLIRALEPALPNMKMVVSTTTTTGMAELQRKLPSHILKVYYPVDRAPFVRRAFQVIHPEAVILVEAEIWPNLIWRARDQQVPLFLVNARLSERSYRAYRRLGFLFRPLFATFTGVGAQTERDAARLQTLGCRPEAVEVVGSLKFDAAPLEERRPLLVPGLLRQLGLPPSAPILIGGSTHPGEEQVLGQVYQRLRQHHPELFLIVVPRHFERCGEVGRELTELGLQVVFRNEITASTRYSKDAVDCLLVNTTGELRLFYEHAAVVFVGKSLTARGGQNPIEPAALGKPIVFGPHMDNFAAIAEAFVQEQAATRVADAEALERALDTLLSDASLREQQGQRALTVVRANQGAITRTVEMILRHLSPPATPPQPGATPSTSRLPTTRLDGARASF